MLKQRSLVLSSTSRTSRVACFKPVGSKRGRTVARESNSNGAETSSQPPVVSEDVLARLRAAEEEAAKLRQQLAAAQGTPAAAKEDVIESKPKRIDSTDKRETMFFVDNKERSSWLTEADVDFFTGGGPGEVSDPSANDPEAQGVVTKRLIIGGLVTAAMAAFALVPTKELRPKPSQPLFFYIVPLLRIQDLLTESKSIIEDANWEQLRLVLSRVLGTPNDARDNMFNCVAYIDDAKVAQKADDMVGEFLDYIDSMDYNKYFDAMTTKVPSGTQQAEFVKFSGQALKAAQMKLQSFISLLPAEDVAAARQQLQVYME